MTTPSFDHEPLDIYRFIVDRLITLLGPSRRHNDSKGFIDMFANNGVTEPGAAQDAEID